MKGIAFTLDAIFALIIASAAISIMLYFQFAPQSTYALKSVDAQNLLTLLLTTNVTSLHASPAVASAMLNQQDGALSGWDNARGGASGQGGSTYGPGNPFLSYTFAAVSAISTGVVADYGNIYFASGNVLYALNQNGGLDWKNSSSQNKVLATPTLYNGQVIYWTAGSKIVDLNAYNGSVNWIIASPTSSPNVPILSYDGELVLAGNNAIYILYANNGTTMSTNSLTGGQVKSLAIASGSIAVLSANAVQLLTNSQGVSSQGQLWSNSLIAGATNIASEGNSLVFGSSNTLYLLRINGTVSALLGPVATPYGVAVSGNYAVFQASGNVIELSNNGASVWSEALTYGSPLAGAAPAIAEGDVYTLWASGYLVSQNLSTGSVNWASEIPFSITDANISIAYGRLYVEAGNELLAYGSCNQNPRTSVLQAATSLYLNGQGSCADSLLNSVESTSNYTIEINGNVLSAASIASFPGAGSYITTGSNEGTLYTMTVSFWAYPRGSTGAQEDMVDSSPLNLMVGLSSGNDITINAGSTNTITTSNALARNSWSLVTLSLQLSGTNTIYTLYVNGTKVASGGTGQSIGAFSTLSFGSYSSSSAYNGMIANVQFYGSVLTAQQVGALYKEGISGGPLSGASDLSWWPLDGDANDYGAEANSGYAVNVVYSSTSYLPSGLVNAFEIGKSSALVSVSNYSTGLSSLYNVGVITWR